MAGLLKRVGALGVDNDNRFNINANDNINNNRRALSITTSSRVPDKKESV